MYGENPNSFFVCKYPVFAVPFVEEAVFSQWIVLAMLLKIDWPYRWGFCLSSPFYSIGLHVCPTFVPYCCNYCSFSVELLNQEMCVLQFFFQNCFRYTGSLNITCEWEDRLFYTLKNKFELFVKTALKLEIILYIIEVLKIFSLLSMNTGCLSIYLGLL